MSENYLLPFIGAIENEYGLSDNKKNILCFALTAMQSNTEGIPLSHLHKLIEVSRDRLYRILNELEKDKFITRTKKGHFMYIAVSLERIEELIKKQELNKNLMSETAKLRLASKR